MLDDVSVVESVVVSRTVQSRIDSEVEVVESVYVRMNVS